MAKDRKGRIMGRQNTRKLKLVVALVMAGMLFFTACGTDVPAQSQPAASNTAAATEPPAASADSSAPGEPAQPQNPDNASDPADPAEPDDAEKPDGSDSEDGSDSADGSDSMDGPENAGDSDSSADTGTGAGVSERTDYANYLPNEMGRIPVVMFHRFVESFDDVSDKYYTNTFAQLEGLLQTLYARNFRLVSMTDFLRGHIDIPAGCKPVVFTFDDGTPSQFSLLEQNGELVVNPRSAVGIMLAFAQAHPDFGVAGTFYMNMDVNFFAGEGSKQERLQTLLALGYDIGTHTWGHVDFTKMTDPVAIQQAFGKNQQVLAEILPDFEFRTLALPYGSRPKDKNLRVYLGEGEWEGVPYAHDGAFAVGAGPTVPVYHAKFDPLYIARVRATGKVSEEADLDWWLENASEKSWYVSDGNPEKTVYPVGQEEWLVQALAADREFVSYDPGVVQTAAD
jgi:hypothetical protein